MSQLLTDNARSVSFKLAQSGQPPVCPDECGAIGPREPRCVMDHRQNHYGALGSASSKSTDGAGARPRTIPSTRFPCRCSSQVKTKGGAPRPILHPFGKTRNGDAVSA